MQAWAVKLCSNKKYKILQFLTEALGDTGSRI